MNKKIKKIMKIKLIRWGVIPLSLFILWFAATTLHIVRYDSAFLVTTYHHSKENLKPYTDKKILNGEKIGGEVKAEEDNLGIVSLRFRTYQRVAYEDEDVLIFRIKEKGSKEWYSQNKYKSGLFFEVPYYPFGFPKIADSKGKTYEFELESTKGNNYNGVEVSGREPVLASKYQENKAKLLQDKKMFLSFVFKKYTNAFQVVDIKFYIFFVFLLPLIIYIFHRLLKEKFFVVFIFFLILLHILYVSIEDDLIYIFIMIIWVILEKHQKFLKDKSLSVGFLFLALCPFILIFQLDAIAERSAAWAFFFITISVIEAMISLRREDSKRLVNSRVRKLSPKK